MCDSGMHGVRDIHGVSCMYGVHDMHGMSGCGKRYSAVCGLTAVACALLTCFCVFSVSVFPSMPSGSVYYAFSSASSNAVILSEEEISSVLPVAGFKGKSVFVGGESETALSEIKKTLDRCGAKEVFSEQISVDEQYISCFYYYTEDIPFYQIIDRGGRSEKQGLFFDCFCKRSVKVNIHVALSDRGVTIGCPFIYGSY